MRRDNGARDLLNQQSVINIDHLGEPTYPDVEIKISLKGFSERSEPLA